MSNIETNTADQLGLTQIIAVIIEPIDLDDFEFPEVDEVGGYLDINYNDDDE